MGDVPFAIASFVLASIVIPFMYFTYMCYMWALENMPEGYHYPYAYKLYITGVGMIAFFIQDKLVFYFFYDYMYNVCKRQPTEELHVRYVKKATHSIDKAIFFLGSSVSGYLLLKDSVWLPWFLGG
jgi:hypothetical protein